MRLEEKKASSNTDGNANNTNKQDSSSELIKRTDIENTPFTVITTPEGSFLTMGKFRLTEIMTEEEAMDEGKKITWNRLVQVVMLLWQEVNEKPLNNK